MQSAKNDIRLELCRPLDGGIVKLPRRQESRYSQNLEIAQPLDALRRSSGPQFVTSPRNHATLDKPRIREALPRHGHLVDLGGERRIDGRYFHAEAAGCRLVIRRRQEELTLAPLLSELVTLPYAYGTGRLNDSSGPA